MGEIIISFLKKNTVDIIGILALFFLGRILLKVVVGHLARVVDDGDDTHTSQKERRAETLGQTIVTTGSIVIYTIILLMILDLFDIDIRPILAGAGIIGLAVGFGAQSLVKDFVSGLFILVEDQYGIGDEVKIGSFEGKVIRITMRSTVLKNKEGATYYVSNGLIKDVINTSQNSKGISREI